MRCRFAINELKSRFHLRSFGEYDPHVTSGPRNWGPRVVDQGDRFYRAQDILPKGRLATAQKVFIEVPNTNQGAGARLCPGDLMLVITGATVGRVAVYSEGIEPGFVSQHVAICRLPKSEIDPRYALWGLLSPFGQEQLLGQRYGQGKPGLNLTNIRNLRLPLPPIEEQRKVVAYLDNFQARMDELKRHQGESGVELNAMLPAILDRALKGEL
jgi:type I restriction enzyme S subunit